MWVKAYIKYKSAELTEFNLLFKYGKIQQVESEIFKGITPFQNNSVLADDIKIFKTHEQNQSNNFCKYFIKKSIGNEVFVMYLKISYFEYLKLQWQLNHYLIQSRDIKIEVLKYIVLGILGLIATKFLFFNEKPQVDNEIQKKLPEKVTQKSDTLLMKFTPNFYFNDFKAEIDTKKFATLDLESNRLGKKFRSVIIKEYQNSKNLFAGHYSFISWGCGSACQMSAIVDQHNGKIYEAPNASLGYEFKADSKMLIINPPNSSGYFEKCSYCTPEIYVLNEENKKFVLKEWK